MQALSVVEVTLSVVLGVPVVWMGLDARERWKLLRARREPPEDDGHESADRRAPGVEGESGEGGKGEGGDEEVEC